MNKKEQPSTYLSHTHSEVGGRFAAIGKETVIGREPAPSYPAGPPWTHDRLPPEPALGFAIDEMEPVGTAQEIKASLGEAAAPAADSSPADVETGLAQSPKGETNE